jgi:hypothetical protein
MPLQGSLSIERMCQLAGVSRAGFYRSLQERAAVEEDMEVRSVIQQIAVEHRRRYGYRRISAELRRRGNYSHVSETARRRQNMIDRIILTVSNFTLTNLTIMDVNTNQYSVRLPRNETPTNEFGMTPGMLDNR